MKKKTELFICQLPLKPLQLTRTPDTEQTFVEVVQNRETNDFYLETRIFNAVTRPRRRQRRQRGNPDYRVRLYYLRRDDFTTLNFRQPTVNNDNSRPFLPAAGRSSTEQLLGTCGCFQRRVFCYKPEAETRRSRSC